MIKFGPFDRKQVSGFLGVGRGSLQRGTGSLDQPSTVVVMVWRSNFG